MNMSPGSSIYKIPVNLAFPLQLNTVMRTPSAKHAQEYAFIGQLRIQLHSSRSTRAGLLLCNTGDAHTRREVPQMGCGRISDSPHYVPLLWTFMKPRKLTRKPDENNAISFQNPK